MKPRCIELFCGALAAMALAPAVALAKPAPRKPAAKPARPAVLGTQQLKGDQAEIGQEYTLGRSDPMNIAVTGVRYSVSRMAVGESRYVPSDQEKLLVVEFTLRNPRKSEAFVRFDTFHLTAVDSKDVNHEGAPRLGTPDTNVEFEANLKPAQKKSVYAYIVVPANLAIPKLIVKSGDDRVLRYDLRGKIKGLPAPFADPADASGATALAEVPMPLNIAFEVGHTSDVTWDLVLEKVEFVNAGKLADDELADGKRFLVATFKLTGRNRVPTLFRFDSIQVLAKTTDDEKIPADQYMLHPTGDRRVETTLGPGESFRFRMPLQIPKDSKLKTLLVRQTDGARTFVFDMANVK